MISVGTTRLVALVLTAVACNRSSEGARQGGALDVSFGTAGMVTTGGGGAGGSANAVALQPDGKIVIAGTRLNRAVLVRLNHDGSLDPTFGVEGRSTALVGHACTAQGVAIQQDGKIVVAGHSDGAFLVGRFEADGSPDTGFGEGGWAVTRFGDWTEARAVAVQADGKIVAVGYGSGFTAARYTAAGALDPDFDGDGKQAFGVLNGTSAAYALAIQPSDQKIVIAGRAVDLEAVEHFAVARLDTDGSLDPTFGEGGRAVAWFGGYTASGRAVALQADGKIVVAGYASPDDFKVGVARWTAAGALDPTFDGDGMATFSVGDSDGYGYAVAMQSTRIVVAGSWFSPQAYRFEPAVLRIEPDGTLDASFDGDGIVTHAVGSEGAHGIAVDGEELLVAIGEPLGVLRLSGDGSLDETLGGSGSVVVDVQTSQDGARAVAVGPGDAVVATGPSLGRVVDWIIDSIAVLRVDAAGTIGPGGWAAGYRIRSGGWNPWPPYNSLANAVAVQPGGEIVLAGSAWEEGFFPGNPAGRKVGAVIRLTAAGEGDVTFGYPLPRLSGQVTVSFGAGDSSIQAVAVQADGRIVIAGYAANDTDGELAVRRLEASGAGDTAFNDAATAAGAFGPGDDRAYALALQPDGKIVVAGYASSGTDADLALVRYRADGTLDTDFGGGDGKVSTALGPGHDRAAAVALQGDGKIVVAGTAAAGPSSDLAVVRYAADGSLDPSFGVGGIVVTAIGSGADEATGVAVTDRGIVVVGWTEGVAGTDAVVLRYTPAGALDEAFGEGGVVRLDFLGGDDAARAVAIDGMGRIVVAGEASPPDPRYRYQRFALARLLP